MYFKRYVLKNIILSQNLYPVTIITGCRQTGKTTIARVLRDILGYNYVSFDDPDILRLSIENPKKFIEEYKWPLIIDEVQKNQAIFEYLEHIVNVERMEKGGKKAVGMYVLTGSQKFSLMKHVTESMCGRIDIINILPLSLSELKQWEHLPFESTYKYLVERSEHRYITKKEFDNIVFRGLFPELWENDLLSATNYYQNLVSTYLSRDIYELLDIKDTRKFEHFMRMLAIYSGQILNISNISKNLGIDQKTCNSWITILYASDIISLVEPYFEPSIAKRLAKSPKLFFNDTGLLCYLLEINSVSSLTKSTYYGHIIETFIYDELYKNLINSDKKERIYYYKDSNQNEIDFLYSNEFGLTLIEAKSGTKYDSSDVKSFNQLRNSNKDIVGKCILCETEEPYRVSNGVYAYPIWWI